MKKKNLKQLANIINSIINTIQTFENDGVVFCPKTIINGWQHDLFLILHEEDKEYGKRKKV